MTESKIFSENQKKAIETCRQRIKENQKAGLGTREHGRSLLLAYAFLKEKPYKNVEPVSRTSLDGDTSQSWRKWFLLSLTKKVIELGLEGTKEEIYQNIVSWARVPESKVRFEKRMKSKEKQMLEKKNRIQQFKRSA